MCSKQTGACFLVFSSLINIVRRKLCSKQERRYSSLISIMLYYKNCVQKKQGLLFNLLSYFCNTKDVCPKQAKDFFYSSLIKRLMLYYEKCVFKANGRLLFSLFIINQYCSPNFLLRNYYMCSKAAFNSSGN